ncbi:glycosyltransferase [Clostridium fessum]|uniref:glycosyltransferase n=1 Tax=Clostridium fessum TaxID=2126740 RepID=UPI0022E96774|nr:glycosyltransferase [Clostridium fessum]
MNLLFIQGGSRWKYDSEGTLYTDPNFNSQIWSRYKEYCDNLTVVLRREDRVYTKEEAQVKFNEIGNSIDNCVALPDMYRPLSNALSLKKRMQVKRTIESEVKKADKVIVRSLGNIYTNTALKCAQKYHKPYVVEVTGFAWESLWYHSLRGKFVAGFKENQYKRLMKNVKYGVYVTNKALQKRYPCNGEMLGCSDVELMPSDDKVIENRILKIKKHTGRIVIGTAAFLDVGWKGQEYVIRAIGELKNRGINNFKYEMIGNGSGDKLKKLISELQLEDCVSILGAKPHSEVFAWLDLIDIYVQPSFMEGLCRSIVEAMSRACPVICTNVGGNYELVSDECLFEKADYVRLADILEKMMKPELQIEEAKRNFEKSKEYNKEDLNKKRDAFYRNFIESGVE